MPGSLKEARKASHYFRFEPLKECSALEFALNHGAELTLSCYTAAPEPPREKEPGDLLKKPSLVFLCDQEAKQWRSSAN